MALDLQQLADSILSAMKDVLTGSWGQISALATVESQKLAQTLVSIESMALSGTITRDQAEILLDMQSHATRAVLLSAEGIGLLVAQQAIDAGLNSIGQLVNKAVGFTLI